MAFWPDQLADGANPYFGIPSLDLFHVRYHAEQAGKMNVTYGSRQQHVACVNNNSDKLTAILVAAGEGPPLGHKIVIDSIAYLGSAISS